MAPSTTFVQKAAEKARAICAPRMIQAIALSAVATSLVLALAQLARQRHVTAEQEVERLKDEFISIAAHELRNPITVLKGFTRILTAQMDSGNGAALEDWQREAIQDIDTATSRLAVLADELVDVTRLQAGRLKLRLEPIDMVALTKRIAARLQATTDRHTITVSTGEEHIVCEVDQECIEQVLIHLLNNAIMFSPDGGPIDISLQAFKQRHIMQLAAQDHGIGMPAQDHGIGMPAQQQSRIFSRFMRMENARERGIGGAGLGLYLSRELIKRHHGRIWFESSEGHGSTFFITLPLA